MIPCGGGTYLFCLCRFAPSSENLIVLAPARWIEKPVCCFQLRDPTISPHDHPCTHNTVPYLYCKCPRCFRDEDNPDHWLRGRPMLVVASCIISTGSTRPVRSSSYPCNLLALFLEAIMANLSKRRPSSTLSPL